MVSFRDQERSLNEDVLGNGILEMTSYDWEDLDNILFRYLNVWDIKTLLPKFNMHFICFEETQSKPYVYI